jgi:hypothetical protein
MDRVVELSPQTPFCDEVEELYNAGKEFLRVHDYGKDVKLWKLKQSL